MASFQWIKVFKSIAKCMIEIDTPEEMQAFLDFCKENLGVGKIKRWERVDPFCVFARLNYSASGDSGERQTRCKKLMKYFNIELPFDGNLGGIPTIYSGHVDDASEDKERCEEKWELFRTVVLADKTILDDPEFLQLYEHVMGEINSDGFNSFTRLLYVINPEVFFPIQDNNIEECWNRFGVRFKNMDASSYIGNLKALHAKIDIPIYELTAQTDPYFLNTTVANKLNANSESSGDDMEELVCGLNTILYGPPGTGKTFFTTPYAVAICRGENVGEYAKDYSENTDRREEIRKDFKALKEEGRIAFVTFHQSYGYEEFIEGIKPVMDDTSSGLKYTIESGVFKRICNVDSDFERAWKQFYEEVEAEGSCTIETLQGKPLTLSTFSKGFKRVSSDGSIHGTFNYDQCLSVYQGERGVEQGGLDNYRRAIIEHLKDHYDLVDYESDDQPRVIIIDEINRGNISKIFGELITLIEDSKRKGADDEMSAILPYSGIEFSVPSNLYIIGTMNTADRSIALMDTALRRRFDFIEMPPDSSLVKHSVVCDNEKTIDVRKIMETINSRIEALYDREHRIGHTYFMGIEDIPGLEEAFKKKIIPLLQEYFYDDYEKIRLVLADNAADEDFQFIKEEPPESELFFGDGGDYTEGVIYSINEGAFSRPETYMKIYDRSALKRFKETDDSDVE